MAQIVVDASFLIACIRPEPLSESGEDAQRLIARHGAVVPSICMIEIANVFAHILRGGVSRRAVDAAVASLWSLPLDIDSRGPEQAFTRVLDCAEKHGLTGYDATYLELVLRRGDILVTLDRKLAAAAAQEGLLVLPAEVLT